MKQIVNIGEMIKNVLTQDGRSSSWLAKQVGNSRNNGHKIIHEKKYNDVIFLIDVSIATGHNFLQDLAKITAEEIEMSRNSAQSE